MVFGPGFQRLVNMLQRPLYGSTIPQFDRQPLTVYGGDGADFALAGLQVDCYDDRIPYLDGFLPGIFSPCKLPLIALLPQLSSVIDSSALSLPWNS